MVQWEASIFEFISKIGIRIQKEMEIKIATMEYRKEGIAGRPITGWSPAAGLFWWVGLTVRPSDSLREEKRAVRGSLERVYMISYNIYGVERYGLLCNGNRDFRIDEEFGNFICKDNGFQKLDFISSSEKEYFDFITGIVIRFKNWPV